MSTPGWAPWTKRLDPVHSGPYSVIGDPSVRLEGGLLRMVYNCYDIQRQRGAICLATSPDGIGWTDAATGDSQLPGRILKTRAGQFDDAHETPTIVRFRGEYLLYFTAYRDRGGFFNSMPASFGLATSADGLRFTLANGGQPVMQVSPGSHDNDTMSSPSLIEYQGKLLMFYTAYCFTNCQKGYGVTVLAASSSDGRSWTKIPTPVLTRADVPHAKDGAGEVEIVQGPDGLYYLFHSLLQGDQGHEIGIAQAPTPYGPWTINPQPIVRKSASGFDDIGPIAPSVVFANGKARMWFHGFSRARTIRIGYAEAPLPLRR